MYRSGGAMASVTTYTQAREKLAALLNEATSSREPVVIRRRGAEDVALIAADELRSLMETAHLLRSPVNAERLLRALARARRSKLPSTNVAKLRRNLGLGEE
jgi:antitoxin YefM